MMHATALPVPATRPAALPPALPPALPSARSAWPADVPPASRELPLPRRFPAYTPTAEDRGLALLSRAAERTLDGWPELATPRLSRERLGECVDALARLVRGTLAGEEVQLPIADGTLPWRALLSRLRATYIALAAAGDMPVDSSSALRMVLAMEQVEQLLEEDAAQRFTHQFSGATGVDAVVEVAHDMRSPLASVLFLVEMLRKGQSGPITPVQERQLGLVYSAAFGLSTMASDLMELARGGERLLDPTPRAFSVNEVLLSMVDVVQPIAEEKRLRLHIVHPEHPERIGHALALSRVLLNLTTNALKFTTQGTVTVTARALPAGRMEFSVRDTGRGIPAAVIPTLFDPFRRADGGRLAGRAFSGAGLGLAICQRLVAAMGGTLRVDTEPDRGTCFSFVIDLPVAGRI